jgi:hypothetical protein
MSYSIVSPNKFTLEQKTHIESIKGSFKFFFSEVPEIISFMKDVESRYILASDCGANLVGLSCGEDISGRLDSDLPCEVAEFAQDFVDEETELLRSVALCPANKNKKSAMLNIHKYSTGLGALISVKEPIIHRPSQSILGIKGTAYKINISSLCSWLPNAILENSVVGNFENVTKELITDDFSLTEGEHEIAFLMIMQQDAEYIARFLNAHRESSIPINSRDVSKCLDELCQRFSCNNVAQLREKFISIGFHRKIPDSFFNKLLGNKPIYEKNTL